MVIHFAEGKGWRLGTVYYLYCAGVIAGMPLSAHAPRARPPRAGSPSRSYLSPPGRLAHL